MFRMRCKARARMKPCGRHGGQGWRKSSIILLLTGPERLALGCLICMQRDFLDRASSFSLMVDPAASVQSEQPPAIAAGDRALLCLRQAGLLHRVSERGADRAVAEDRPVAADQHIVG